MLDSYQWFISFFLTRNFCAISYRQMRPQGLEFAIIQKLDKPVPTLALELGIVEISVRIWCERDSVEDRSRTAYKLQTTLPKEYERVVVELRKTLLLSLDGLLLLVWHSLHPKFRVPYYRPKKTDRKTYF
ncbi:hypothetical protein DP2459 [Desulfotalea psychrophila LSv54]|uniref:Uncharacterized protein n=1 Tax=Desulfotalea psychrophila (strain LSv54 / DSM 12343) TaxID=177439 RepID=Q6AKD7_DESPS|nr:hypothetical protein DP2459 [Desulfotalea psychrophila LSv54]